MAVTPTFPSRDSLRRLRFRPLDAAVGAGVFLLIYVVVRVGVSAHVPIHPGRATAIDTSPSRLPYYAARSVLRMFVALFFAYTFSLGYAYVAARNRRPRRAAAGGRWRPARNGSASSRRRRPRGGGPG